jgi:GT2 family glycosyltransferase
MDTVICSITKNGFFDTILYNSIKDFACCTNYKQNNKGIIGLSQFYNECIDRYSNDDKIKHLIFCHDDVQIINSDFAEQVKKGLQTYDVLGVAGCINPKIIEKNLWHWMAGDKQNWRGIAGHPYEANKDSFYVTSFGPTPSRVAVIDGVFMAINLKKIVDAGVRFDEQFKFHHYDIDFSLQCNKNSLKIGVWPILINHKSPGLKDFDESWNSSNEKFINKWKNK